MSTLAFDSGDKVACDVEVTQVGPNLFRVDEITTLLFDAEDESDESFAALPNYGDVIHAVPAESGNLKFVRVHERGGFAQRTFYLPKFPAASTTLQALHELVGAHGGIGVVDMGGVFTYAVPQTQDELCLCALERFWDDKALEIIPTSG